MMPLLATRPQHRDTPVHASPMQSARLAFAIGAACMILGIAWFLVLDLISIHA
jgi:hypothetical protein